MTSTGRICSKCGILKPLEQFHRDQKGRDGRSSRCKECAKKHVKAWAREKFAERYGRTEKKRKESADLFAQGKKRCSKCGKIKPIAQYYSNTRSKDGFYSRCKSCHDLVVRAWESKNPDKKAEINRASKERNREDIRTRKRERWKNDLEFREKEIAIARRWKEENLEKVKKYRKEYSANPEKKSLRNRSRQERLKTNPAYKVEVNLRRRIIKALKGEAKSKSTMELLGCSHEKFIEYIEGQFEEGMTWENYGYRGWHLDHIIPCAAFDLTDPEQQKRCFHYTNLQPLWWKVNLAKKDKFPEKLD